MWTQSDRQHRHGLSVLESKPSLIIGVDLDNTLINYDTAFLLGARDLGLIAPDWHGDKGQIREYLRLRDGGEAQWQCLQGQVYGRLITHARLFDDAYRFLWRCRQRGYSVDLVSHKTEYGHRDDNKVPLRKVAIDFLQSHGVIAGNDNLLRKIYFENTREAKVLRIVENGYDWFIDDLPEVLEDVGLPKVLGRILLRENRQNPVDGLVTCCSWVEIENRLLGDWTESELFALAETVASTRVASVKWLTRGGNSGLIEVTTEGDRKYALKLYPGRTAHDRLSAEYNSFKLISEYAVDSVPLPFRNHLELNAGMYEWIEGGVVSHPDGEHIQQALRFLEVLHGLRDLSSLQGFHNASAAFLSGFGFEKQLRTRFNFLSSIALEYPEMHDYLQNELFPIMENILRWTRSEWWIEPGYFEPLPRVKQTLSPSDFGFHNAIERANGKLAFIDFEYFGWDDPVKLIADFGFHPGMQIDSDLKQQWVDGAVKIYGEEILDRLRLAWPMIGLSWCLILLNEYRGDIWLRRCAANADKFARREEILAAQLKRSRELLARVSTCYSQHSFC
jgi:thiamine kinase-like enzyme